jgi:hypothetical protein
MRSHFVSHAAVDCTADWTRIESLLL